MILISLPLALIAIVYGANLLAQSQRDNLAALYKYLAWFVIMLGFLTLLGNGAHCLLLCHRGDGRMMGREYMMMDRGDDGMMGGGHTCMMHGKRGNMMCPGNNCCGGMMNCKDNGSCDGMMNCNNGSCSDGMMNCKDGGKGGSSCNAGGMNGGSCTMGNMKGKMDTAKAKK